MKTQEEDYDLTETEEALLEESIAAGERGEWVDADEFMRELRQRLDDE